MGKETKKGGRNGGKWWILRGNLKEKWGELGIKLVIRGLGVLPTGELLCPRGRGRSGEGCPRARGRSGYNKAGTLGGVPAWGE